MEKFYDVKEADVNSSPDKMQFVVARGEHKKVQYYIISDRCNPKVEVKIEPKNKFWGRSCHYVNKFIAVHKGVDISYYDDSANFWLGWEYSHLGDFVRGRQNSKDSKKYSVAEVRKDAVNFINQLVKIGG